MLAESTPHTCAQVRGFQNKKQNYSPHTIPAVNPNVKYMNALVFPGQKDPDQLISDRKPPRVTPHKLDGREAPQSSWASR